MSLIRSTKPIIILFFTSSALYLLTTIFKPPLPSLQQIHSKVTKTEPQQSPTTVPALTKTVDKYTYHIKPLAQYQIHGLVVSTHDTTAFTDISHDQDKLNTHDLCLVWGQNITSQVYQKVHYSSGDWTCYISWNERLDPSFDLYKLSNNHILPANDTVRAQLKTIRIGDQITLTGLLADYEIRDPNDLMLFSRSSSTTREDIGNGACEILYLQSINILQKNPFPHQTIHTVSGYTLILSTITLLVIFFHPHRKIS